MSIQYDKMSRLLDGEMTETERRFFLQNIDKNHPEKWRELALGFVENQIVIEALRSRRQNKQSKSPSSRKTASWNFAWMGGVAAALILGLFLGTLQIGQDTHSQTSQIITPTQKGPSTSIAANRNIALAGGVQPLERLNSVLKKQGYDPQMTRGYIEAEMADGRQLIVPISQLAMSRGE